MALGRDRRQRRRRAAVIGGAAVAAKKHHDAKEAQGDEAASQQAGPGEPGQEAEPAAAGGLTPDVMEQLKQLGELHEQNVLSDEEFEREKAKLLSST
jgi:hypothetical protein